MLQRCLLIDDMDVRYDDEQRIVIIENRSLHFSRNEFKLMHLLLTYQIVKETMLLAVFAFPEKDKAVARYLAKYINRIRNKLASHEIKIRCVHGHGYMLISEAKQDTNKLE